MKNLRVYIAKNIDFAVSVAGHCIDGDNGILFVLTEKFDLFKTQTSNQDAAAEKIEHDFSLDSIGLNRIDKNDIRLVEFLVESGSILVALQSGHIIRLGVTSYSLSSECIYNHDKRISSIKLSPDQDLIALADEGDNVHIMSIDGTIIHSSNALSQNDSLHKPVGVGWGSKETQFFGLDGRPSKEKQLKDQIILSDEMLTIIDKIESSDKFKDYRQRQERSTVVDWRGDGQYIGTLTFLPDSNKHYLKVWNRNLELQYISEQLVTVERGILSWVPNGQYICCAQRRDRRINDIAMFEKNGMVHQRITLPPSMADTYIRDIAWSHDSKILAIVVSQFSLLGGSVCYKPILLLYTMQNFHYYLKHTASLADECDYFLRWDPVSQNKLHIISSKGYYHEYECSFEVTYSDNYSTVAVVDSNRVLLTPMQLCNIPPPMSAITLQTNSPIHKFTINPSLAASMFIVTLDNKLIYTTPSIEADIELDIENAPLKPTLQVDVASELYASLISYKFVSIDYVQSFQHLVPIDEFCLAATRLTQNKCDVLLIHLPKLRETTEPTFKTICSFENKQVMFICPDRRYNPSKLNIVLNDKTSLSLDLSTGKTKSFIEFYSTTANSRLSYSFLDMQTINSTSSTALITLGQDLSLRFNTDVIVSNACTSFRVTENYLIYTTNDNSMHCILLDHLWSNENKSSLEPWIQSIETGGTLIIVSESDSKVVLQMPRGNLEIIHPRVLIFSSLTSLLDKRNYLESIKLARRHRLNMNFLCDYLLRLFCKFEDLNRFANDVAAHDPSLLSLFITELDNCDTITGRYESIMKHLPSRLVDLQNKFELINSDKVNQICSVIKLPEERKYLQPRLLCLLKMKPRMTGEALKLVHKLDKESQVEALKFMLYFIDIDQLFMDALCTYDTDITLMVASASNKDPKEYLVLLDNFNSYENSSLRRYKIDMHVKRYDEALKNLLTLYLESDDKAHLKQELIDLVESKRLYRYALSLLNETSIHDSLIEIIWSKYAEYLLEKRHYIEAGLAYSKALDLGVSDDYFNSALKCFSLSDDWEKSIAVIAKSRVSDSLKKESLRKISKQLMDRGKCHEAIVVLQPMKDGISSESISELVKNGSWYLADFIASGALNREEISSAVIDLATTQSNGWSSELTVVEEQFKRLKELVVTYQTRKINDMNAETCFISDSLSTVDGSELSSISSVSERGQKVARSGVSSIKTRTSSKSNKSQAAKKKRINLKSGSRHEDLALILELKKFIAKQKTNQNEAVHISAALYEYCPFQKAKSETERLNGILSKGHELARTMIELLWPIGPLVEQKYSLYRRFSDVLSSPDDNYENIDFEVLLRPDLHKDLVCFDL